MCAIRKIVGFRHPGRLEQDSTRMSSIQNKQVKQLFKQTEATLQIGDSSERSLQFVHAVRLLCLAQKHWETLISFKFYRLCHRMASGQSAAIHKPQVKDFYRDLVLPQISFQFPPGCLQKTALRKTWWLRWAKRRGWVETSCDTESTGSRSVCRNLLSRSEQAP